MLLVALTLTAMLAEKSSGSSSDYLEPIAKVPSFTLRDQADSPYSLNELQGKIWVADFFLTSCQGACPVMSSNMAKLQSAFKDDDRIRFVSFSVDPEVDTPSVLAEYSKNHTPNPAQWKFLTGPIAEIHRMAGVDGLKVGVPETPMAHSQRFVLIDADVTIRGYYDGMDETDVERCAKDIRSLLAN
ncbi:MAG: SCO family protein [Candidatus Hydrogenedentes bacterium]|nr:SCO family protein [Candidatus Hydrogenedentota bacterium]